MQRLGANHDGYHGETIAIDAVLQDVAEAAARHGWREERLPVADTFALLTLQRMPAPARQRVYLSTGIHGDEPAGPLAVRQLLQANHWPADCGLWICPCLNPAGFRLNRRENEAGVDLNRDYRHRRTPVIRTHVDWLQKQPAFDLALCLHEDWEAHGFYVYELNPEQQPSLADKIVAAVAAVCPIDPSPMIEGREARGGIIRPSVDPTSRPDWPEAFYLIQHKTRRSYTLEAPSDWPLATRVAALVAGVNAALAEL
jgi:predicted deacylase